MLLPRQRPKLARGAEDKEDADRGSSSDENPRAHRGGCRLWVDNFLLHGPALTIGQIVHLESVDELQHARIRFPSA